MLECAYQAIGGGFFLKSEISTQKLKYPVLRMTQAQEQIAVILKQAGRSLTLVEITHALNAQNSRARAYSFDEVRGHLEQMDEVHESRGTYCLKG